MEFLNSETLVSSDEAKNKYVSREEDQQKIRLRNLQMYQSEEERLREKLQFINNSLPDNSDTKIYIQNNIVQDLEQTVLSIKNLEHDTKSFDSKWKDGFFLKEAEANISKMLEVNNSFIEEFEKNRPELENYLKQKEEDYANQKDLVYKLQIEKANLADKKSLALHPNNDIENLKNDSKIAFYVSTNIARLGIMIITIFLAQVFITIYRYLTKLSDFYQARADALEILTQTETLRNADLPTLIALFSNIFSPEKVDFGALPQAPTNEVIKGTQSFFSKF